MLDSEPARQGQVDAAAERLESLFPGYLAKVRRAAARLGVHTGAEADDLDILLEDLADQARIDVEVPTASRRREGVYLKKAIKLGTRWYLRYLADQMTAFGESVSRLGRELAARTDALDARTGAINAEVEALKRRVDQLEAGGGAAR
jgi:hypothetical protein